MKKVVKDALKWVNTFRVGMKRRPLKKLPRGYRGDVFACPIANALDGGLIGVGENLVVPVTLADCFLKAGLEAKGAPYFHIEKGAWYLAFDAPEAFDDFVRWFDSCEVGSKEFAKYGDNY